MHRLNVWLLISAQVMISVCGMEPPAWLCTESTAGLGFSLPLSAPPLLVLTPFLSKQINKHENK